MKTPTSIRKNESQKFCKSTPLIFYINWHKTTIFMDFLDYARFFFVFLPTPPSCVRCVLHTCMSLGLVQKCFRSGWGECAATRPQALQKHHKSTAFYQRNTIKSIVFYNFCHRFLHKKAAYRVRDSRQFHVTLLVCYALDLPYLMSAAAIRTDL